MGMQVRVVLVEDDERFGMRWDWPLPMKLSSSKRESKRKLWGAPRRWTSSCWASCCRGVATSRSAAPWDLAVAFHHHYHCSLRHHQRD